MRSHGLSRLPAVAAIGALALTGCPDDGEENPFATTNPTSSTTAPTSASESSGTSTTATTESDTEMGSSESTTGPAVCGDGVVTGDEECDCVDDECTADELDNKECGDLESPGIGNFTGGTLSCNNDTCKFDTIACVYCGDGTVNGIEDCEADSEIVETCATLDQGTAGEVVCGTDCLFDTTACTDCGYHWDLEGAAECMEWSTGLANNSSQPSSWACGNPNSYTGGPGTQMTGMWATNLTGAHNANESSYAATPILDFSACDGVDIQVTVEHWHNFEGGSTNRDGAIVQLSENGGQTWAKITPTAGDLYFLTQPLNTTFAPPDGQFGFSGREDDQVWKSSTFSIPQAIGQSDVQLRFVFGSDSSTNQGGWYINTVDILGIN